MISACTDVPATPLRSTIGQAAYIHRSGFGVTATGAEVYVGGLPPAPGAAPQGYTLFPDERVAPQHYLTAASSRDFYTWTTRQ